jgi:hypothetical protein
MRKGADGSDGVAQVRKICGAAPVYLVDVGGERPFNYYFTELAPEEPLLVARRPCRFRAVVEAKGTPTTSDPRARVTFLVNQVKKEMREVPLASGSAAVTFDYRFPAAGEYEIEAVVEGDTHRLDNHRYYLAAVPECLKLLLVAEPGETGSDSPEAAFLAAAISPRERPGLDPASLFTCKMVPPGDVVREDLADYAGVIVLGLTRVPADLAVKLESYVRDGGSALLFLSGRSNAFEYNERLFRADKGLLPAKLHKSAEVQKEALAIALSETVHPALRFCADEKLLQGAAVTRYMTLANPRGILRESIVASFSNGQPALLENKLGRGKVLTFCTAAGPPDNYLPASPAYPVLLQELLRYLAGNPDRAVNLEIGQAFHQDVLISSQHLVVRKPDGTKVRVAPAQGGADRLPSVSFDQTDQAGRYVLDVPAEMVKRPRFVVNLQSVESDLDRVEEKDVRQLWPDAQWLRPGTAIESVVQGPSWLTEWAGPVLWVLVVLLALETLLAVRFGMRRH